MEHGDVPIRLYRPGSGTEGMCFYEAWCARCVKDRGFDDEARREEWCQIIADTHAYDIKDPKYPVYWITVGDEPQCTAFVENVGQQWPPAPSAIELEAAGQTRLIP